MTVKSADRKPEKYVGPDGKTRIRMVPVDKEVVKTEAAPKVDLAKYAAHLVRNKKPKKMTSTQKTLADISKRANEKYEAYETEPPSPDEKSMAMRQGKFIQYVGEELMEYMEQEKDFPEWMQNKLSELHQKAKDMHAVLAGEYEDDDMDEEMNEYGGPPISREKYLKQKPMKEEVELAELTAAEKKLVDQMYDKKGNLTPLGKKIFAKGQKNEGAGLDYNPAKGEYNNAKGVGKRIGTRERVKTFAEISKGLARQSKGTPAND